MRWLLSLTLLAGCGAGDSPDAKLAILDGQARMTDFTPILDACGEPKGERREYVANWLYFGWHDAGEPGSLLEWSRTAGCP
jgi:hypothetical protein